MTIYQRIGEAIASQGKVTLVAALTPAEEHILTTSGFKKVGTMDLNGTNIDLFEVKVTQVVNAPVPPYNGIRTPSPGVQPYKTNDTYPRKYEAQWPENYRLYTYGTGTPPDVQYRGSTTSLVDAAYNPLSILSDYTLPENKTLLKIDIGSLSTDEVQKVCDDIKRDYTPRVYTNDSWTSYNQGYTGNRDFRSW